jgi:glycine/D-amino acid oxidase-like deaminating enzyme
MFATTHPDAMHFEKPVPSYWEESADPLDLDPFPLSGDDACDVAVIGAGYSGLSAAIELAEQGLDVRVLEAAQPGWGASGRNGGFACVGSHKLSYSTMIKTYGLEATRSFYRTMKEAVALVKDNCDRHGIDAWATPGGEVTLAHLPNRWAELQAEQTFMKETFGEETTLLTPEELAARGLKGGFHGGLMSTTGTGVHPLNYVRGLARAAARAGVYIHGNSPLLRWEESMGQHVLHTRSGSLRANQVIIATNGYSPENLIPWVRGRLLPALSSVIVTAPLTEAERQAQGWTSTLLAYDSRNLLHYFRLLPNGRFLFGGRGGTDGSTAGGEDFRKNLVASFHELFPAWRAVDITHYWRGYVCLTADRVPYVGALDERQSVWTAIAYHGNGVAMGSWSGRAVARLMTGKAARDSLSAVITRRLAKFPLPAFRPLYLKGAYVWFGWQDAR